MNYRRRECKSHPNLIDYDLKSSVAQNLQADDKDYNFPTLSALNDSLGSEYKTLSFKVLYHFMEECKMTFTNSTLFNMFAKRASLTPDFIKENNISKEEIKVYNDALKVAKKNDKLRAFKRDNCTIEYKENTVKIQPCFTTTEEGKSLIIFKDISSDAYVVISAGKEKKMENGDEVRFDHLVEVTVTKRVTDKANKACIKAAIVSKLKSFLVSLLKELTAGVSFEEFSDVMRAFTNKKDINCPKVLKNF